MLVANHEADVAERDQVEPTSIAFTRTVGSRLRSVRTEMRLSLQAIESISGQEFRASVLGAYERGERAISLPRLQRLARLYDVPVDLFLPPDADVEHAIRIGDPEERYDPARRLRPRLENAAAKITIDLNRLHSTSGPESDVLAPFLSAIQAQRRDFRGPTITIRAEDHRIVSSLLGVTAEVLCRRLDDLGLRPATG